MEELQKNLFQVTHEKVKALMELATMKRQFQLQHEFCNTGLPSDIIVEVGDMSFQLHKDIIYVVEAKSTKRYGDCFIRQTLKFEELISELDRVRFD